MRESKTWLELLSGLKLTRLGCRPAVGGTRSGRAAHRERSSTSLYILIAAVIGASFRLASQGQQLPEWDALIGIVLEAPADLGG